MTLRLYGYWRSTASYRVRIALALKGLAYEQETLDLRRGQQLEESFRGRNPQGLVPTLEADGKVLTQSPAILEWLEERYPEPPLLPAGPEDRAIVRAMAALICCDIHPLNNLRVLEALRGDFAATPEQVSRWIARWIGEGFTALEILIAHHGGQFAVGDLPTLADCCLVPQVYAAERFTVPLAPYPRLRQVTERARALPAFAQAHPDRQPDADPVRQNFG